MDKITLAKTEQPLDVYRKICILAHFFISDKSKWIFPDEFGINHLREDVQYSSAQHDTLTIDYYSFWYTQTGKQKEFLHCSPGEKSIIINGVSAEENPDADALIRLSKAFNAAEAKFIYEKLERMFVFSSNGVTVNQYIQGR